MARKHARANVAPMLHMQEMLKVYMDALHNSDAVPSDGNREVLYESHSAQAHSRIRLLLFGSRYSTARLTRVRRGTTGSAASINGLSARGS